MSDQTREQLENQLRLQQLALAADSNTLVQARMQLATAQTAVDVAGASVAADAAAIDATLAALAALPAPSEWAFDDDMQSPADPPDPITGSWDPARYYYTFLGQRTNPNGAGKDMFTAVNAQHCLVPMNGVLPPMHLFACGPEFGERMHLMTALCCMQDDTNVSDLGVRQPWAMPADGSPWECQFEADICSRGEHDTWPAWAVSDTMAPGVYGVRAAFKTPPRNGILILFNAGSPVGVAVGAMNGVSAIMVYRDGKLATTTKLAVPGNARFLTTPDVANMASVKLLPEGAVEVWVTDAGRADYRLMAKSVVPGGLPLAGGYVHVQQAGYGPAKEAHDMTGVALGDRTIHWHGLRFNGPKLEVPRLYSHPQNTIKTPGASLPPGWQDRVGVNLGYLTTPTGTPFNMPGRDAPCTLMFSTFASSTLAWQIVCNGAPVAMPVPLSAYEWNLQEVRLPAAPNGYQLVFKPATNMVVAGLHLLG